MASIASLNVQLTANVAKFAAGMRASSALLSGVKTAYSRATDSAAAYKSMQANVGRLRLAGSDTIAALQTTLAVARSELRRFTRNQDVQVAVEFAREHLAESWIKIRSIMQAIATASGISVAAWVVADRSRDVRAWLFEQGKHLTKPLIVRMELARRAIDTQVGVVRSKLESLKQYRSIRIILAAVNATKLPVQAALATLRPIRLMGRIGIKIALKATHIGIAIAAKASMALLHRLGRMAKSVVASIVSSFRNVARGAGRMAMIGTGAMAAGISGIAVYAIKLAADAEQARVAFTTMLGSAEKARDLQNEINKFAAETPFNTPELIDASKSLLAFGIAQQQIIPTMRTLGDVSAGLGIPIGELSDLYGKAKVQGRLMAQDVNQLTGRGIPVIGQFAKQFGVAEGDVRGLVESGKIGFPQLQKALVSLTGEGGKLGGMMAAQSQTVSGLWSSLTDTVTLKLTDLGETITEKLDLRGAISGITDALDALGTTAMPIIEGFIGSMGASGNAGQKAGQLVLSGSELIATGLAYALSAVDLLAAGWRAAQSGVAYAIGGMLKAVDWMGSGIVKLLNMLPGVNLQWTDTIGAMSDGLIEEGNKLAAQAGDNLDAFSNNSRVKSVGRFFDGVRANAAKAKQATEDVGDAATKTALKIEQAADQQNTKVAETLDKLRGQIAEFGQTDTQKLIGQMQKDGATKEQIMEATGMRKQLDALEQTKKHSDDLMNQGKSLFDSTRTPMEKYEQTIGNLSDMLNAGAIDWDTYGRAIRQAKGELEGATNASPVAPPDIVKANSAEAQRHLYELGRGLNQSRDDLPKKQFAEQKESNRHLDDIARNTAKNNNPYDVVTI